MTDDHPLLRLSNRGLQNLPPVSLDPQEIERFVTRRLGVARVAGDHWRPAFEALCEDLAGSAKLSPLGRILANGQLVGILKARCRADRLLARHPAIHAEPFARPIIIMGPMRSGSTRLQRLLACDPRLIWTRMAESLFPVPGATGNAGRIAAAAGVHGLLRSLNPAVQRIHPSGPLRPDEEFGHLSLSLSSAQFSVQWKTPGLLAVERGRDLTPVVHELRSLLRINSWARGGAGERRWLLKCPAYGDMAEALMTTFPDAAVIHLSRDPAKVVASSASLVTEQRRIHSETIDRHAIGQEWLDRTVRRQRLVAAARSARPQVAAFDLHYDEMTADWEGAMHRCYRFLGLPLTAPVLCAMRRYMARARAHRGHSYALEDYGLTDAAVRRAFAGEDRPLFGGAHVRPRVAAA